MLVIVKVILFLKSVDDDFVQQNEVMFETYRIIVALVTDTKGTSSAINSKSIIAVERTVQWSTVIK